MEITMSFADLLGAAWGSLFLFGAGSVLLSFSASTRAKMADQMGKEYFFHKFSAPYFRVWPVWWYKVGGIFFICVGLLTYFSMGYAGLDSDFGPGRATLYTIINLLAQLFCLAIVFQIIRSYRRGTLAAGRVESLIILIAGTKDYYFIACLLTVVSMHVIILIRGLVDL